MITTTANYGDVRLECDVAFRLFNRDGHPLDLADLEPEDLHELALLAMSAIASKTVQPVDVLPGTTDTHPCISAPATRDLHEVDEGDRDRRRVDPT